MGYNPGEDKPVGHIVTEQDWNKYNGAGGSIDTIKAWLDQIYDTVAGAFRSAVVDHGGVSGLADDDHPQYHDDARGDARYYTKAEVDAALGQAGTHVADVKEANYFSTAAPSGAWQTLVSIVGAGYLDMVAVAREASGDNIATGQSCQIQINIDGRGYYPIAGRQMGSLGNTISVFAFYDVTNNDSYSVLRAIFGGARFAQSCVIQVQQASGSTLDLWATAHYRQE